MKKLVLAIVFSVSFAAANLTQASVADKLVYYVPNRIVDLCDIMSISMGFGPSIRSNVRITRAFAFGGGIGAEVKMVKEYNRQYGFAQENGWEASFMMISAESKRRSETTRLVKEIDRYESGTPLPSEKIYDFYTGARDYWDIGGAVACLVEVDLAIHPVEIADFIAGFLFIDLRADDFTGDEIRP